jgi:hypothetical protein
MIVTWLNCGSMNQFYSICNMYINVKQDKDTCSWCFVSMIEELNRKRLSNHALLIHLCHISDMVRYVTYWYQYWIVCMPYFLYCFIVDSVTICLTLLLFNQIDWTSFAKIEQIEWILRESYIMSLFYDKPSQNNLADQDYSKTIDKEIDFTWF